MAVGVRVAILAMAGAASLPGESLEIEAQLLKFTPAPTVKQVAPYPRALATYLYEVKKVHKGSYQDDQIVVVKWAVWEKGMVAGLPSKVGAVEHLTLDRLIDHEIFDEERIVDAIREVERVVYYDPGSRPEPGFAKVLKGREKELEAGVVAGEAEGWFFLAEELRHAETGRFWERDWRKVSRAGVDPLPAMLDFQRRLKELGVQLLIVPVPTKVSCHPEQLQAGTPAGSQSEYLDVMRKAGLQVVDLKKNFDEGFKTSGYKSHLQQDSHWSPRAIWVAGRTIGELVKDRFESGPLPHSLATAEIAIRGDLARMLPGRSHPPELVFAPRLRWAHARVDGVKLTNPKSPVLLLGDSHVTVFSAGTKEMFGSGSGLPDALAARFFFEVDVVASHGDGIDQARVNLYQQRSINPKYPDYWRNKKLVVWVFSAREFTRAESWSTKIPVVKKKG